MVYITCKNKTEAKKISRWLLRKKLIACANFFPISSMYTWKGKIESKTEYALFAKTIEKKFSKVSYEVEKIHSYGTPCIEMIRTSANSACESWLKGEVK
ncbi:MAG: divalent-cation tolerance protein CutA [Candidatus Woesearchaeota archaeon]